MPGEYLHNESCLTCQEYEYSVNYDSKQCIRVDPNFVKNYSRSSIDLQKGFWKFSSRSHQIESCFKEAENCLGGWTSGDHSCKFDCLGALCEECDIYNLRGFGEFLKLQMLNVEDAVKTQHNTFMLFYQHFGFLSLL